MERKNAWEKYDESGKKDVFGFSEKYRKFISSCKTERECVKESVELAKAAGYKDLYEVIKNNPDDDITSIRKKMYETSGINEAVNHLIYEMEMAPSLSISYGRRQFFSWSTY